MGYNIIAQVPDPSVLKSLPIEISVLVVFAVVLVVLIRALTPIGQMLKEQYEARITRLEASDVAIQTSLTAILVTQSLQGEKLKEISAKLDTKT